MHQPIPVGFGNDNGMSRQDTGVTVNVTTQGEARDLTISQRFDPVLGELSDRAGQARSKSAAGHHGDVRMFAFNGRMRSEIDALRKECRCHFDVEC